MREDLFLSQLVDHEKAPEEIQGFLKQRGKGVYISPLF